MRMPVPRAHVAALALVSALASGCYKTHYVFGGAAAAAPRERMPVGLVFGLVELEEVTINDLCPTGIASAYEEVGFVDGLISWLTVNLVTTHTVKVWCADGTAWDVETDDGRVVSAMRADAPSALPVGVSAP